ncbi:hypothetical protein P692DRAFT_201868031 [Suillus brevipes Sb2]|nr:hypothetical protein P692DRAFT_201868031 [Suillus brevipes Sb2]
MPSHHRHPVHRPPPTPAPLHIAALVGSLRVLSSLNFCRPALQLNYRNQQLLISAHNLLPSSSHLRHHLALSALRPQRLPPTRLETSPHHRTKQDLLQPLLLCHPRHALLGPMLPELPIGVQQQPPTAAGHVQPIAARPAAQGAAQPNPDALFHFAERAAIQARLRELEAEEANGAYRPAQAPLDPLPAPFADPATVDRACAPAAALQCGVPWSLERFRRLASIRRFIRFDWNIDKKTFTVPAENGIYP